MNGHPSTAFLWMGLLLVIGVGAFVAGVVLMRYLRQKLTGE